MSEQTAVQYPRVLQDVAIKRRPQQYVTGALLPYVASPNLNPVVYTRNPLASELREVQTLKAPGFAPNPVHKDAPTRTQYTIRSYALMDTVNDEDSVNDAGIYADERAVVENLVEQLALQREIEFIAKVSAALTTASNTATPSTKFDASGGTPLAYLRSRIALVSDKSGVMPNTVVMGLNVANAITTSAEFRDTASYTVPPSQIYRGIDSLQSILSAVLGVDRVLIGVGHQRNTAAKGKAPSLTGLWSDNVLIGNFEAATRECASLALSFYLEGDVPRGDTTQEGGFGFEVRRADDRIAGATKISVLQWRADEIVYPNAGYWVTDTLT